MAKSASSPAPAAADPPAVVRVLSRVLDCTPLRLCLFLTLSVAVLSPMLAAPRQGGYTFDWLFFQFFDEVARQTILEHHQFPIWNPYFCGGTTLIGNPQTTYLVPTFPLVLLFGTTFGERLSNIPVLLLGCEGMWRLLRFLGLTRAAALLGALAFPFFGRTFGWINNGQHGLPGFALSGWVLYGYLRGLVRPVYLALGAAFFAWQVLYRGIETTPEVALGLFFWGLLEARQRLLAHGWANKGAAVRAALWPLGAGLILGLLALGFAGIRMFPVLELVLKYPRIIQETRVLNFSQAFVEVYAVPPGTRGFGSPGYVYVSIATYVLFVGAVLFARPRARAAMPLLITLFFMMLTLGMHGPFSPLPWLHQLPLLRSLRNPTLWSFAGAFFLVIAAAYGLDALERFLLSRATSALGRTLAYFAVAAFVIGTGADLLLSGYGQLHGRAFPFTWETPPRIHQAFRQSRGNYFELPLFAYADRGTLSCYDETPFPASPALRPDLPAEEYLAPADADAGAVERLRWSPNRIDLRVTLRRPATLLINQNYADGWRASIGQVHAQDGLLAVDLPAGTHTLALRMWPPLCTLGLVALGLALFATAWLWRKDRLSRQQAGEQRADAGVRAA